MFKPQPKFNGAPPKKPMIKRTAQDDYDEKFYAIIEANYSPFEIRQMGRFTT